MITTGVIELARPSPHGGGAGVSSLTEAVRFLALFWLAQGKDIRGNNFETRPVLAGPFVNGNFQGALSAESVAILQSH